jgi:hypothetical protein
VSTGTTRKLLDALNATSDDGLRTALIEISARDNSSSNPESRLVVSLSAQLAPLQQSKPEHLYSLVRKAVIAVAAFRWVGLTVDARHLLTS